jgi:thioredoxin 1
MQSTLIVYKGKTEMGRSTGDTNEASITSLLNKAL